MVRRTHSGHPSPTERKKERHLEALSRASEACLRTLIPLASKGKPRYVYDGTFGMGAPRRAVREEVGSKGRVREDGTTPRLAGLISMPCRASQWWQCCTIRRAVAADELGGERAM